MSKSSRWVFIVVKYDETSKREIGISSDGTTSPPKHTELLTADEAQWVCEKYGGRIVSEFDYFGDN